MEKMSPTRSESKLQTVRDQSFFLPNRILLRRKIFFRKKTFFLPDFTGPILALAMNEKVFSLWKLFCWYFSKLYLGWRKWSRVERLGDLILGFGDEIWFAINVKVVKSSPEVSSLDANKRASWKLIFPSAKPKSSLAASLDSWAKKSILASLFFSRSLCLRNFDMLMLMDNYKRCSS